MFSRALAYLTSWYHTTPLPSPHPLSPSRPIFQIWHQFDQSRNNWTPYIAPLPPTTPRLTQQSTGSLNLVTWNINGPAPDPKERLTALLLTIQRNSSPDVIFFQEVTKEGTEALLDNEWVKQGWVVSDIDIDPKFTSRGRKQFCNITLISKSYLSTHSITLGAVWRVPLPSHMSRSALCFDILLYPTSNPHSPSPSPSPQRIRLINVHLDSLPITPSYRPTQLSILTSYLRAAGGQGLIAGDFNPVLLEDEKWTSWNGLVDAWEELRPGEEGVTWGVFGESVWPARRMDKVAVLGIRPVSMRVLQTHSLVRNGEGDREMGDGEDQGVHFSDHFGLVCSVGWGKERDEGKGSGVL